MIEHETCTDDLETQRPISVRGRRRRRRRRRRKSRRRRRRRRRKRRRRRRPRLRRHGMERQGFYYGILVSTMCSFQDVFSIGCVLHRMCSI
jgi:hypothetical protein